MSNPSDKFVIVPFDYMSPILSIRFCLGNQLFDSMESAESFLIKTVHNIPHLLKLLKIRKVPRELLWRLQGTLHPYQLYPVGMHVKLSYKGPINLSLFTSSSQHKVYIVDSLAPTLMEGTPISSLQHVANVLSGLVDVGSPVDIPFLSRNCIGLAEDRTGIINGTQESLFRVTGYKRAYTLKPISQPSSPTLMTVPTAMILPLDDFQEKLL
jgi:hypothetical protein